MGERTTAITTTTTIMTRLLVPVSGTRQLLQPGLVDRSPPAQNRRLARLLDRHPQLRPGTAHADRRLPQAHQNGKKESGVRRNGKEEGSNFV